MSNGRVSAGLVGILASSGGWMSFREADDRTWSIGGEFDDVRGAIDCGGGAGCLEVSLEDVFCFPAMRVEIG